MLLLLLQVVDGQYAFVLHTANPLTGRHGDMFGELVAGLGEVLVSTAALQLHGCYNASPRCCASSH
jgi:phosphoenolpyruvate synthase/pyruvate phosphate dikinase